IAAVYYWWPKWTGRMLNERLGYVHFWMLFIGFHMTFLIQHWLGVRGMPRRYADYSPADGFTWMNQVSTVGAGILAISTLPFLYNVYSTWRNAPKVAVDDPWGYGNSLEWATSCPPPRHNFVSLPRIRSERPAFDLHHPEVAAMDHVEPQPGLLDWEAQRTGNPGDARRRIAEGTAQPEKSSTTVIDDLQEPEADR
ncbi:MAG: cytochrome ubiquinol oxidase subunit I, partial [Cellulomonas sp. 14-74-6]